MIATMLTTCGTSSKAKFMSWLMLTFLPALSVLGVEKISHGCQKNFVISKQKREYSKHKASRNKNTYAKLKGIQAEFKRKARVAKSGYLDSLAGKVKTNPKQMWKFVKSNRKETLGIPPIMVDGSLTTDERAKASCFNRYFQSVFTMDLTEKPLHANEGSFVQMPEIEIGHNGILSLLNNLKVEKAIGPDGIPNHVLKSCADIISCFLFIIFTRSLQNASLPHDWKHANVVPVHKSGARNTVENYRPISLTSVSCKIMEHIIYSNLISHLNVNSFFIPTQHGFRAGFSCDTQLTEFAHDLAQSVDSRKQVDCVFLDFRKAFDTVPHCFILEKLKRLNIDKNVYNWIANYLTDRKQCVVINGVKSPPVDVTSGVPQGSVLGPLLFLIFINDITQGITSRMRIYADDCILYREINSDTDVSALQIDLDRICLWCLNWGMTLSIPKCCHVRFTRKRNICQSTYTLHGETVNVKKEAKYLGVLFSDDLRWLSHVNYVTGKASRTLGFLRRNFSRAPQSLKQTLFFSCVKPILEYACVVWDPSQQYLIDKIERIQNRAARFVTNNYNFRSSVSAIKNDLQWKSLAVRRKYLRLNFFTRFFMV